MSLAELEAASFACLDPGSYKKVNGPRPCRGARRPFPKYDERKTCIKLSHTCQVGVVRLGWYDAYLRLD